MKQCVIMFSSSGNSLDTSINSYLKKHPNYSIYKITPIEQIKTTYTVEDRVLVVFNVDD